MQNSKLPSAQHALAVTLIVTGVGILVFWALFFTIGLTPTRPPICYFEHELAFPLPDTILAIALIASGLDLRKGGQWGRDLSLVCGGALIFLGVLDLNFTALNGGFQGLWFEVLSLLGIFLWCIGVGAWAFIAQISPYRPAFAAE